MSGSPPFPVPVSGHSRSLESRSQQVEFFAAGISKLELLLVAAGLPRLGSGERTLSTCVGQFTHPRVHKGEGRNVMKGRGLLAFMISSQTPGLGIAFLDELGILGIRRLGLGYPFLMADL